MWQAVVVGVDGSARSRAAVEWAAHEARLRGLPLRLVHIAPSADRPATGRADGELAEEHEPLRQLRQQRAAVVVGAPVETLLALSETAHMLVLGVRGDGGHAGLRLGSVATEVASHSACPVVLVPLRPTRRELRLRPDKVTLGVDARDVAEGAVDFAFDAARERGARLHALHSWSHSGLSRTRQYYEEEDQEMRLLSDALRPWREKHPQVRLLEDVFRAPTPGHALLRTSASAELLVVGRRGEGLGPTLAHLLPNSRCPVAVAP
ncbi:universal stress protein [Streptomyces sp. NPDC050095]|uniref:universal stress protein n=1 Tax=unclassified Streptomyces TaxID=2593676 RepID=UPI0034335579